MVVMRSWLFVVACAACTRTSAPSSNVGNRIEPTGPPRTETDLRFTGTCDTETTPRYALDEREHILIITCFVEAKRPDPYGDRPQSVTAYLVRRTTSEMRGTSTELGRWTRMPEQGEYYELDAGLRDARGHVTHVFVRHMRGGLDQVPEANLQIYLPDRDAFATKTYAGMDIGIEVAANGAAARIVTCRMAPGGTYHQDKTCAQQKGAIVETFTIP